MTSSWRAEQTTPWKKRGKKTSDRKKETKWKPQKTKKNLQSIPPNSNATKPATTGKPEEKRRENENPKKGRQIRLPLIYSWKENIPFSFSPTSLPLSCVENATKKEQGAKSSRWWRRARMRSFLNQIELFIHYDCKIIAAINTEAYAMCRYTGNGWLE